MGVEDFVVILAPVREPVVNQLDSENLSQVADQLRLNWPGISDDKKASLKYGINLCYETDHELFQIKIARSSVNSFSISLRFAYCNPATIDKPFCDVIEWLMEKYRLECRPMKRLTEIEDSEQNDIIAVPSHVARILIPAIQLNRKTWRQSVSTDQEAALRPEEIYSWLLNIKNDAVT